MSLKTRILWLIVVGLLAVAFLFCAANWNSIMSSDASNARREQAEYLASTWLIAFTLVAGVWIWLLVKTIRNRRDDTEEP